MDRQQWLAVRDSGSLGQCLRSRERYVHVSKPLEVIFAVQIGGDVRRFGCHEFYGVTPNRGTTLNTGRNKAKRERKAARKSGGF